MAPPTSRIVVAISLLFAAVCHCQKGDVKLAEKATVPGDKKEFYIVTMMPSLKTSPKPFPFVVERVSSAIDIAMETVKDHRILPAPYKLIVSYADSRCDSAMTMNEAIKFFLQKKVLCVENVKTNFPLQFRRNF